MKDSNIKVAENVWKQWERNVLQKPNDDAIVHWVAGEEPLRWGYSELLKKANEFSLLLKDNGIKRGEVCAIIIRHNFLFYPLYMGVVGIGAIPAVLAYPNPRLHPDKFRQGLEGMSHRSGLDWIFTERELESIVKPLVEKEGSTLLGIHFPIEWEFNHSLEDKYQNEINEVRSSIKGSDPFLLQHSSGTTGLQKPVLLSHKAVLDHVVYYGQSIQLNAEDKVVSWLPLYHDM
ncbi:MAG: class I adenylate-forming enzyme family protein, partial [Ignavibacteria bacterium]|nr:class I adenylate-forming enzyme family protein [Ignavibacteria bacterium]